MTRPGASLPAAALLAVLGGCGRGGGSADSAAIVDNVRNIESQMVAEFKARDADALAGHYADDAMAMNPGSPPAKGHRAILENFRGMQKDPAFAIAVDNQKTVVGAGGDIAYTRGAYRVTFTDPATRNPVREEGAYVTIFRKQPDGSWKIVEDIASPSASPIPTAVAAAG